jgi:hypothetical protein
MIKTRQADTEGDVAWALSGIKGIAGQSHSVPCTLAWNRGSEKPIISPRQPTPTIKSNAVDRTQDLRLQKSADKSNICPFYTYLVRQLTLGLLFLH